MLKQPRVYNLRVREYLPIPPPSEETLLHNHEIDLARLRRWAISLRVLLSRTTPGTKRFKRICKRLDKLHGKLGLNRKRN